MNNETYQGWTNRETWLVHLWLTNEEPLYNTARGMNANHLADYVDLLIEDDSNHTQAGFIVDLLNAALARVNWQEVADSINAE